MLPGVRGVGPEGVADLLKQYGALEAIVAVGRFPAGATSKRQTAPGSEVAFARSGFPAFRIAFNFPWLQRVDTQVVNSRTNTFVLRCCELHRYRIA